MKHNEITDAERVLFNPNYIKKLEEQSEDEYSTSSQLLDDIPDDIKEYVEELSNGDKLNNELVQQLVDYLSDPMNSASFREKFIFKSSHMVGGSGDNDEDSPKKWKINIPIFSGTF